VNLLEHFGLATRLTNSFTDDVDVSATTGHGKLYANTRGQQQSARRYLIPSLCTLSLSKSQNVDDGVELHCASIVLRATDSAGQKRAVCIPHGVFTRLVGKVVWWSQKTHGRPSWELHANLVTVDFGALRVRVALAHDDSRIRVSVPDAPRTGVSVDTGFPISRVDRFVNEVVRDFLGGIVDVTVEMGPSAPAVVNTTAPSGVFMCHSGNVTTDSVFAEGFHDVQTALVALRGEGAVYNSHGTSSTEWCRVMREMGTVVIVVSSAALRARTLVRREQDTVDDAVLQWIVAATLANSGIVQLHVIALDDVDAAVVKDVRLPAALLEKASELVGDKLSLSSYPH
jgi:hypothetical protein